MEKEVPTIQIPPEMVEQVRLSPRLFPGVVVELGGDDLHSRRQVRDALSTLIAEGQAPPEMVE